MTRFGFILLVIACIGMFTCITFAEENAVNGATIRGEVIEATAEQKPIEGVTVKIVSSDGKEFTVKTDAKGKYEYKGLSAGRYTINVSKRGYNPRIGRSKVIAAGGEIYDRIKMRKRGDAERRLTKGLLQHVAESIGEHYKLDASEVKALRQSIVDALDTVLEHENLNENEFASTGQSGSSGLIITMLSHPDCKAAFAKYLTEAQLQEYINLTKARQQRYQQAVAQFTVAFLDQALSLTVEQRENMVKLLLDTINDRPELDLMMDIFGSTLQQGAVNLIHNKLNISLDNILNETQAKIWRGLVGTVGGRYMKDIIAIETFDPPVKAGKINDKSNETQKRHQTKDGDSPPKSEKWILAEAILMAHTEQLGLLNKSASKHLELATKGVIQQYLELPNPGISENLKFSNALSTLMVAVMMQSISREEAEQKLESIRKELWEEGEQNKRWGGAELSNITKHPLYQQAIKDVLSEDAYKHYRERQTKRDVLGTQASRDLIVAYLDLIVLLNDTQREQLKMTEVTMPLMYNNGLQLMFTEFFIRMNHEILSSWQQSVFRGGM